MDHIDCVVVGAGVVGLAVARAMALGGRETIILESASAIGTGISSRNSEVIHAGIYYPHGSWKARLCVEGRELLYAYCNSHHVPHRTCGKLIVATSAEQVATLNAILAKAESNGVTDLQSLAGADALSMEPHLHAVAALHSPSTGIVDTHALMQAYLGDATDHGAALALSSPVVGGRIEKDRFVLDIGGAAPTRISCTILINAAGLDAQNIAKSLDGFPHDKIPSCHFAKGNYFSLSGRSPFSRLIYPVPEPGGLGVHLTLDMGGQARFGPDVEWVDQPIYDVDPQRSAAFYPAIRRYWPDLPDGALQPGYAGIRPKLVPKGTPDADFVIQTPQDHGVDGLINLFGIESPGLTSSLAIAQRVSKIFAA